MSGDDPRGAAGRLDQELVRRGLARSRTHAGSLINEGRVRVAGRISPKASTRIMSTDAVVVAAAEGDEYVSRAGHKLAGALDRFPELKVAGLRCLDAGASTGGFTDVLLRRGAAEVVAVDVGHDQMVAELRADRRVHVHEGLNVRYLDMSELGGVVSLVVADLSFISLRLVMRPLAQATAVGGDLMLMVKPQFEVGREALGRTGVVGSRVQRRRAVADVLGSANEAGLECLGLARSPLPGQDGNVEFFLWLRRAATDHPHFAGNDTLLDSVDYS
ncbi:TlyA family RNA methyltransferase [Zhihengliuella halotolerans]|uniref:23S rRNA (Cytidine1920-2'-O)/16S rRNA (Cytidine1409-2'-O)-methyltransferase n=1 Tax=Zhihengliuella halotolerans TaxID=370736 RepID=A0A4Q8ADR3_9MICC|nr:TlyA family RNA methyltransferase [Zhihengliuella halotolerans]RZU61815.1 23S rRNA (cytidine1920-2'-O)/16S rRNA (cytidine1409-2'-O)-methyltransferase [Zhihengliuella halotolerans]